VVSKVLFEVLHGIFNERFLKIKNVDKIKNVKNVTGIKNVKNVFYIYDKMHWFVYSIIFTFEK